jgi:apolipoprotein N-acyltransferase
LLSFMFAEWFRGSLFGIGGLPWNMPGMIWAPGEAISQSASIWGIYGLSALTVVAMARPQRSPMRGREARQVRVLRPSSSPPFCSAPSGAGARAGSRDSRHAADPVTG